MIYTEAFCTACTLTQPVVTPHLRPNGLWAVYDRRAPLSDEPAAFAFLQKLLPARQC
jgi:hypothetical protein